MERVTKLRPSLARQHAGGLRFALLVLVVLVLGHDLTYLAASGLDGLGIALARSGHGAYWPFTWLVALGGVVALAAIGAIRALSLLRRLARKRLLGGMRSGLRPYRRELLRTWPRIALLALLAFVSQEAIEHFVMHGGHVLQAADFITGTYAATLPAFAVASLLVAGVAALFTRAIEALEEAVRAAAAAIPRAVARMLWPAPPDLARIRASLSTPDIGRAPPLLIAS